jgi:hypothetical protein
MSAHTAYAGDIFQCIRRASLIRHISFTKMRLKISDVAKLLPEILAGSKHFQKRFLPRYEKEMSEHNSLLARGMSQGLSRLIPAHKLICPSLDSYLLRMHSEKLSDVLESLTAFAKRISPIILDDTDANRILINKHLLIHQRHLHSLGRHVLRLVRQICALEHEINKDTAELCPTQRRLQAAASQAALVYTRMIPEDAARSRSVAFLAQRRGMARHNVH